MTSLDWHAKPFSSGDMDGVGTLKMFRGANVPLAAMLVRETAQNSWDARLPGSVPRLVYHGFDLSPEQAQVLKLQVFRDVGGGTILADVLAGESIGALEIADRGTSGLGGPTRNDLPFRDGESTDWVDFVLTLGARQDTAHGGGTFGFGKVIAYLASSAHTVIVWSRAMVDGKRVSRLIGSAMGESFEVGNRRYTGRQWWGRKVDDRIEPLEGDEADTLAEQLFSVPFSGTETGTSILVLGPEISSSLKAMMEDISTAVLWNLWPKLIPDLSGENPMPVSVRCNSQAVEVPDPTTHPVLRGFVSSLGLIRETQDGSEISERPMSEISEIRSQRPKKLLGHLAVTNLPTLGAAPNQANSAHKDDPVDHLVPIAGNAAHIALMRNRAELVVTYRSMPGEIGMGHRCGVFRPALDVDDAFALSEPPAHDKWEPASIEDKPTRRYVNVALNKMKEEWRNMTSPTDVSSNATASEISTAALSNELADLVPALSGTKAAATIISRSGKAGSRRKKKRNSGDGRGNSPPTDSNDEARTSTSLKLVAHDTVAISETERLTTAHIHVHGPPSGLVLSADIAAAFDGGTDSSVAASYVRGASWFLGHVTNDEIAVPDALDAEVEIVDESADWTLAVRFDHQVSLSLDFHQRRAR